MKPFYEREAHPGVHALIVGVSDYTHLPEDHAGTPKQLGLRKLQSGALTAFRIADWLVQRRDRLALPLASCRLLVAPSAAETKAEPRLQKLVHGCTSRDFTKAAWAWRADAATSPENIALFYFAGHGAQRLNKSHVMLMQDFGEDLAPVLEHGIDTNRLITGMQLGGEFLTMAETQLYFIDACRVLPSIMYEYDETPAATLWDTRPSLAEKRSLWIFHASSEGESAYARKGEPTLYSRALLDCLNAVAAEMDQSTGEPRWFVRMRTLSGMLDERLSQLAAAAETQQQCRTERLGSDALFHSLDGPPEVDFSIEVRPDRAYDCASVSIYNWRMAHVKSIRPPIQTRPIPMRVPAGNYQIAATIEPPTPPFVDSRQLVTIGPRTPTIVVPVQ